MATGGKFGKARKAAFAPLAWKGKGFGHPPAGVAQGHGPGLSLPPKRANDVLPAQRVSMAVQAGRGFDVRPPK